MTQVDDAARATERVDRVSLLFEGANKQRRRTIVTPEGVALAVALASHGDRLGAFCLDMLFWLIATACLYAGIVLLLVNGMSNLVAITLILFIAFLVRTLYFVHFELAWRGVTPGKRICGLKVIDRSGGALTAAAIVARNLTREVEIFLPLGLLLSLGNAGMHGGWERLATLGWVGALTCLPLFNRDHLRGGDLIAGTMVIAMPKRVLAADLAAPVLVAPLEAFTFTPRQLQAYGAYELQVLEELLRQPPSSETQKVYVEIAGKIRRRTGWTGDLPPNLAERFLRAFYAAERAELERDQLFGRLRADKDDRRDGREAGISG